MDTPTLESLSADLLPSQWRDLHRPSEQPPISRMFLAVLEDALRCWQTHQPPASLSEGGQPRWDSRTKHCRHLFFEADIWLFHPEIVSLFSFNEVCEVLDIEPDYLRRGLNHWRESHVEGQPRAIIHRRSNHSRVGGQIAMKPPRDRSKEGKEYRAKKRVDNGHHPHGGMREVKKTSPYSSLTGHQKRPVSPRKGVRVHEI